jgi:hypothetical protein
MNMTDLDAIVKKFFVQDGVTNQIHEKSFLFDKLAKAKEKDAMGKDYTYAIRTGRNRYASRPIAEAGDYGTFGSQTVKNIVVPNTRTVTGIELSADVVNAATGGNKGAFVSAFAFQSKYSMSDMMRGLNRQLHSDGTDALCFWTAADDTSGTNVDDGQGNGFPVFLEPGATTVDIIDATDHSTELGADIVLTKGAETASEVAVTWTGTITGSADGDYAVLAGSLGKAPMGIRGIIAATDPPLLSGGLHGLTVAANADWKAQVFSNSGTQRALTLDLMQQPLTEIGLRSSVSEGDIDFLLCNGRVKDKFLALLVADQVQISPVKLKGGHTSYDFNGKPVVVDPMCRRNTIYYINTESMDFLTATGGITWASFKDGSIWKQKIGTSGYADAYQAILRIEGNLACKQRNANAVLLDLID